MRVSSVCLLSTCSYISHLHYHCEDYVRLGNSFDGGWDMCIVEPYRPRPPCLIYSFG